MIALGMGPKCSVYFLQTCNVDVIDKYVAALIYRNGLFLVLNNWICHRINGFATDTAKRMNTIHFIIILALRTAI